MWIILVPSGCTWPVTSAASGCRLCPLTGKNSAWLCASAPLTLFQFQRFPSKIPSLSSLRLPAPSHIHRAKRSARFATVLSVYGWTQGTAIGPRDTSLAPCACVRARAVYSDIVSSESAGLSAADCSEWEACVRAATKGWSLRGSGNAARKQKAHQGGAEVSKNTEISGFRSIQKRLCLQNKKKKN